jgi:endonuclease YncB( thermonuclease family)
MLARRAGRCACFAVVVMATMLAAACGAEPDATPGDQTAGQRESEVPGTTASAADSASGGSRAVVAAVIDGDTIELRNGARVRLVQIDAPETDGECFSRKATRVLREMVPAGTRVRLLADPRLDKRDRYGRLLRYVFEEDANVNLELVRHGAASVWFYEGVRGRYAKQLMRAARKAKSEPVGLWLACRGTVLDPMHDRSDIGTSGREL